MFKGWLIILGLLLVWKIWDILAGVFLAIILATIVDGAANFLKKIKFPRVLSVALIYLVIFAAFYFAIYFLIPPIIDEINQLADAFPKYLEKFSPQVKEARAFLIEYRTTESFQKFLIFLGDKLAKITSSIPTLLSTVFGGMLTTLLIIFISLLLSFEKNGIEKLLVFFVPQKNREEFSRIFVLSQKKIRDWFKSRLFSALVVGFLVYIGLLIMGAKYKITLALISALFEFIPIIGPWVSAIIGTVLVGFQSAKLGIFALILYVAIQQVESHIFTPLVTRKIVGMNAVLTILAVMIGAKLGGILGILIAVPLAAVIVEIISDFRKKGMEPLPK